MKSIIRNSGIVGILLMSCLMGTAQDDRVADAHALYEAESYKEAIVALKDVVRYEENGNDRGEALYLIGKCYHEMAEYDQAELYYLHARKCKFKNKALYYDLGTVSKQLGKYSDAKKFYGLYKAYRGDRDVTRKAQEGVALAKEMATDNASNFDLIKTSGLNSSSSEFAPFFYNDEVYFSSTRSVDGGDKEDNRTGENFSDIYVANQGKDGTFTNVRRLPSQINTEENEGGVWVGEKSMYFTRCSAAKKHVNYCNIYQVDREGDKFGMPRKVIFTTEDSVTIGHPFVTNEGNSIIFSADLEGSVGGQDLWQVDKLSNGRWSKPYNMGSTVNTEGDEAFPTVMDDTLYFASNRLNGMGGFDIYKVKLNESWGSAENMLPPINSGGDDFSMTFDRTSGKGLVCTNRSSAEGHDHIYRFYRKKAFHAIQGTIIDHDTKKPVAGVSVVLHSHTNIMGNETVTDETGFYSFDYDEDTDEPLVVEDDDYIIEVAHKKYLTLTGQLSSHDEHRSTLYMQDFEMINYEKKELDMPQVVFEEGNPNFWPESKDSLHYVYNLMVTNPTLKIELHLRVGEAGLPNDGKDMAKKRAQRCADYLVGKGINRERIQVKAFKATAAEKNATGDARNKITFSVLHR